VLDISSHCLFVYHDLTVSSRHNLVSFHRSEAFFAALERAPQTLLGCQTCIVCSGLLRPKYSSERKERKGSATCTINRCGFLRPGKYNSSSANLSYQYASLTWVLFLTE
jgi:hypothetical protein